MPREAIVVGGGIAGLAAAIGLGKAGWRVRVFEREPASPALGAGIGLTPNGARAMKWLGLDKAIDVYSLPQGAANLRTSSGRWLMRTPLSELEKRYGVPGYTFHRADMHRLLTDAMNGAAFETGHRVTAVSQCADSATVTYEGPAGRGTASADLVVAADGLHSGLRAMLFPGHPGPEYAGYFSWRAIVSADDADGISRDSGVVETWGRGKRFGIYPLSGGRVCWYAAMSGPERSHTADGLGEIAAYFRGWHEPIGRLLRLTSPDALLRHDIYHLRVPVPSYVKGRVALVGDAAHAMTPDLGQGACMGLEGAVQLASLTASRPDIGSALAAYDRAQRPRAQRMLRASEIAGRIAQARNPVVTSARNAVAWLIPSPIYLRSAHDTYSWMPPPEAGLG